MELKILVATHKPYWMPQQACYLPIEVGAAGHAQPLPGCVSDAQGENISDKNAHFCELTALYWGWKNLEADAVGLAHYRRHFGRGGLGDKKTQVATEEDFFALLAQAPVILPKPRHYYIETSYSQYAHAHHAVDLQKTRDILQESCPEYLPAYDRWMQRTWGHRFNMLVMRRDELDAYCEWLFGVLFELERRLDISAYNANDSRVFGFVSERLLDCWLETNAVDYREMPVVNMESQHWLQKGARFLRRKFVGKNT